MSDKLVEVAVAVLQKPDGEFLLAQRPAGKPYAGYWEFPGGKVEPGEKVEDALKREIKEELGVEVTNAYPWITQIFHYPHAKVNLHFYRVTEWIGEPHPHEEQSLSWQRSGAVDVTPLLPANGPVLKSLSLPTVMAITNGEEMGVERFMSQLEKSLHQGIRFIQIREKTMPRGQLAKFSSQVVSEAKRAGAWIVINGDEALANEVGANGVHLSSQQLMSLQARPDIFLCGASCHNEAELLQAENLGLDYVVLGPVQPTLSHPGAPAMGWERFAELAKGYSLPIYGIGGLTGDDMHDAWKNGAHGIAMIRGAWR